MPVPSSIADLSQTPGSNSPSGSESPITTDNYLREYSAYIAQLRDGKNFTDPVQLASATTTDIGAQNSLFVEITGTTTITGFGTTYNGPRFLRFTGILILTHNATTLNLPSAANITTAAGDTAIAVPNSTPNGWNVVHFQRASGAALSGVVLGAATSSGLTMATSRLLGRTTASTGAIEEISAAASLSLSAGSLGVADSGITTAKIADANITASKLDGAQSGSAPIFAARAMALFNGTTTGTNAPTMGGNVTSVTRNGVGDYTVNLTTAVADANAVLTGTCYVSGSATFIIPRTDLSSSSAIRFTTLNNAGAATDCTYVHVAIYR